MQAKRTSKKTPEKINPDHSSQLAGLNRIQGQVEAVKRMIVDNRYCPEIIQQIRAARSALGAIEEVMLVTHLKGCVADALHSKESRASDQKIEELMRLLHRAQGKGGRG